MAAHPLTPIWLTQPGNWTLAMASHLLRRAGFGGTLDETNDLLARGPQRAVASLLAPEPALLARAQLPEMEFGALTAPGMTPAMAVQAQARGRGRGPLGPQGLRPPQNAWMQQLPEEQRRAMQQIQQSAQRIKEEELRLWWLDRMIRSPHSLQEKMTLFWHGLLVSSSQAVRQTYLLYKQNQLYRKYALGNYRQLMQEVSKDPAMLIYLNNNQNVKARPNENYARELMELFTMGIGNYTESDIKESARAFTGWANAGDQFIFRPGQHDEGMKTFLGRRGNFNGDQIVDIIFQQPATARYIATRLLRFFAIDDPPTDVVTAFADVVKRNDFELKPTLQTLFTSTFFYSEEVMQRQIKSPTQLIVGTLRALGATMTQPQQIVNALRLMGQDLFNAPTVKGWDGGRAWINTSTLFARYNLPAYLGTGRLPAAGKQAAPSDAKSQYTDFDSGWIPQVDLAAASVATTDGVVDLYLQKLLGFPLDPRKRNELIEYMNGTGDARTHLHDPVTAESERRVRGLVHLIMAMAEYQLC